MKSQGFSMFGLERMLAPWLVTTIVVIAVLRRVRHTRGPL